MSSTAIFKTGIAILSIIIILSFLLACSSDWQKYQQEYNRHWAREENTISPAVRAISYPELKVNDKCISCHVGIASPATAAANQPLTSHPGNILRKHDWKKIGCTICHEGNGSLATDHAHDGMLKAELVQTSCQRCHPRSQSLAGAENLTHGKELFIDRQCSGCHYVEGLPNSRSGPSLNGIASRANRKWLKKWLLQPARMMSNAKMPDFHLSEKHADALAAYLITFTDGYLDSMAEPPAGDIEQGGNIMRRARCISCHPFNGRGGYLAPDLGRSGNKSNRKAIYDKIRSPKRTEPSSIMPRFNFSQQQLADLTDYILDEYTDYDLLDEFDEDSSEVRSDSATIDLGRQVYKELRCANCHILDNEIKWMQIGPRLSLIGQKKLKEIDFGNSDIPRTLPDYLFEKIRNPQAFATAGHPQKMPHFNLTNQEIFDLTIFLLSLRSDSVASPRFAAYPDTALYRPAGEYGQIVEKFQCFSCHRINGRGFNLAYDLSIEGDRVDAAWLYDYLIVSYSIRPILVERMPIFNFSEHEARLITDHILENYRAGWISRQADHAISEALIPLGRELVQQKGCLSCHISGDKGGYVGPSFTTGIKIGRKLKAEWIYHWLKDPQKLVPGVLEPNYNLSDKQALAITAYLMSLK